MTACGNALLTLDVVSNDCNVRNSIDIPFRIAAVHVLPREQIYTINTCDEQTHRPPYALCIPPVDDTPPWTKDTFAIILQYFDLIPSVVGPRQFNISGVKLTDQLVRIGHIVSLYDRSGRFWVEFI